MKLIRLLKRKFLALFCKLFVRSYVLYTRGWNVVGQQENEELNSELNVVYRYLLKKGIPHTDAEDAVQEAAYKYLRFSDSIHASKVRSWLIRVSLNYYYDQYRKNKKHVLHFEEKIVDQQRIEELPELLMIQKERTMELNSLLSKLRPLFSELIFLKYELDLSYIEIAQLLGISTSSVKTNLFRARRKFLKLYEEGQHEE